MCGPLRRQSLHIANFLCSPHKATLSVCKSPPPPDRVMPLNFQSPRAQPLSHTSCLYPNANAINTFLFHDWRVLPGRPFAVELLNPHRVHFTSQEVKELQQVNTCVGAPCLCSPMTEPEVIIVFPSLLLQKINKASDKIQVRDLQLVTR